MPQAPTWEETVAVPSWEDTVDESQAPEPPKETEQEFVQRMGKPIVPTKAQLNEPRIPKDLFEPFKKIPRVDSNDPRFRAAVSGALGQPASDDALSSVAAILNSAAGFAEGIESPAGVATAAAGPLGKVAQKLAALGWGAYSAAQVPEAARTAGELSVTGTPQEKKEAYLGLAGSIAIPAAIGAGVVGESPARGLAREISQAVPKFEDTSPIPITERGERAPLPTDRVKELISKAEPILPRAAKEAAVSVEEQARLQKELAEELGREPVKPLDVKAELSQEGVTQANIDALIKGTKTPEQVVNEQLKVRFKYGSSDSPHLIIDENPDGTRTASVAPEAGPARMHPRNIGMSMPHDEALAMAIGQGVERINSVLERYGLIPKRLSQEEEFKRIQTAQQGLEEKRIAQPSEPPPTKKEGEAHSSDLAKAQEVSSPKEKVTAAAIKINGEIATGADHAEAVMNYANKHGMEQDAVWKLFEKQEGDYYGFVTSSGRFIDLDEAARISGKEGKAAHAAEILAEPSKPPPTPAPVKAEPSGRDWDAFTEELIGELDSFSPARHTGRENYELNDVADRFAQFAKADTSGKPLDKLVSDFAKVDEASTSQIRKLRQGVKSLLAQEKLAEPSAPPPPAQPKGETGRISGEFEVGGKKFEVVAKQTENPELVRIVGVHRTDVARPEGGKERTDLMGAIGASGIKKAIDSILKQFPNAKEVEFYRASKEGQRRYVRMPIKREPPPTPPPVEQKGVGPATGEGPGATVAGPTGIDPKAQIEQLADSFRNIEGQKLTIGEKLKQAFQVGERLSGAKDALSKALDGLKSTGNYLIGKWNQVQNIDDLLRAKGDLSAALETRGWRVRQWEKLARKATPSLRDQAAIAKYVDAGGDMAELQRGFTEAPPNYKQAYQDAMNLKGDLKIAAENIRNYFDSRLQEAIDAGVLEHGVEDYIHRIYESKPKVAKQLYAYVQTGLLQKNPALTKKRIFQFDWEAEKLGYKPVQSYIPRIAQYESSLARAIAAREFIKKATTMRAADGRPVIDIKGVGIPIEDPSGVREATLIKPQFNPANKNQPGTPNYRGDYVNKEFPALSRWKWVAQDSNGKPIFVQGDVAIHPDYVNRVAALLEPSRVRYGRYGAVARPALAVGSAVKQTMLDLSGFHQVQTTVHGLEHRVNPLNLVQEIDFNNPDVDGLLKGGVTLGGDYRMQAEGLAGQALTRHIPFLGPALESYHQWLFQDYIPRLKMTMALHALERNKARYSGVKSPEEIYHQTASEANAAFGEQNYIMLERSKTAQDMARLILLAPDFLEARGRFAGQALTKGGKAFGNEQRTALLLGALTMYVTARILNKATTGQYHNEPENLFSVVHNGKAYGLRTVQGDILHLIEHPLQFWMHRLNPVFGRTTLEMATGRDEFGRKRSMPEQLWDFASTVMPISLRTSRERSIWESLANSFGINARRWQDTDDAFKLAKDWKAKHGIGERGEFIYDRDKDPLRPLKLALTSQDEGAAVKEIKKLIQSKTYTIPKLNDYFRRYASMPFTGSRANDVAWKRTLSEDQLKTVDAAKQHKESIRQLYMKALAKVYAE